MNESKANELNNYINRTLKAYKDLKVKYDVILDKFSELFELEMEKYGCQLHGKNGIKLFDNSIIKMQFGIVIDDTEIAHGKINFQKIIQKDVHEDNEDVLVLFFNKDGVISDKLNDNSSSFTPTHNSFVKIILLYLLESYLKSNTFK